MTHYFFPEYSGTTTRLYNLVSRLPFPVQVFTSDRTIKGALITLKEERFSNIKVNRIPLMPSNLMPNISLLRYIYMLWFWPITITRLASREQFDIIHAHNPLIFGEAAERISMNLGKPFVLELHGVSQESTTGVLRSIKALYMERATKKLLARCDHIVTLTHRLKEWISTTYKVSEDKITVVPNGADIEQFSPKEELKIKAEEIRERLGAKGKIVMYAGIMDRINGMEDLVGIAPQIIREKPDICFILIGFGPMAEKLMRLSKEYPQNMKFLPMVPYQDMPVYYQMCDIFVIPRPSTISSETVTPLKLLEVMAMGKPVLGSNVGGITEVVKDKENSYLFEKGNLASFKRTLLEVLSADNTQISYNARRTIMENYTWGKSVNILQKVYEALV